MDALRTKKVAREIQKQLGILFHEETRKTKGVMISVTEVRLSPDLSSARVFLSIFPDAKAEEMMESIKRNTPTVRYDLGRMMASQLRHIPELIFELDTSEAYAQRIDELLGLSNTPTDKE
ncbi:MAG: 30S ribosome-binding factor RbfA [Bacteroidales bacterium]|uniref:30S ribosome-binding factor RbfA n=1 Tax=Porphyromonas sp. TaxID=1924944 RepID=UPI0029722BD4|nr:30S ribosome-binding factor RbfA [Porphyromonas sp.]MDD7437590.1 30S ribosome-binding factor RbfA [Bacteroidales bacterium]MDY3066362.1 30S ribosome-binding factor RbfA [Porphyromonas sp.]